MPSKKRKRKQTYKSMMQEILKPKSTDTEKKTEQIYSVTGGGHCEKVSKI